MDFRIRLNIKDSEGDTRYDYSEEYIMSASDRPNDITSEFTNRIRQAVCDLVSQDAELAEYIVTNYGYADGIDSTDSNEIRDYVISTFPLRGVAQIPDGILEKHGIKLAQEPDGYLTSYDDDTMFA